MNVFDVQWLTVMIAGACPLLYAISGEVLAQRAGVVNVGLEGMMLVGAFFGFAVMTSMHSVVLAFLVAAAVGALVAAIVAYFTIYQRADQVVVGIAIDILALGLTGFLYETHYSGAQVQLNPLRAHQIPLLSRLPYLGHGVFDQPPIVYGSFLTIAVAAVVLCRTRLGLVLTAVGDAPQAADLAGVRVLACRWTVTVITGALGGIGGAFLSVGQVGQFVENMTNGRGYLAFAAVIIGQWTIKGSIAACLLFGGAEALELRLQGLPVVPRSVWIVVAVVGLLVIGKLAHGAVQRRHPPVLWRQPSVYAGVVLLAAGLTFSLRVPHVLVPSQVWLAWPYVFAIVILASVGSRRRMPMAFAQPYRREDL